MKFRKRITVLPGVRINLSGSGVSVTAGVPGLSVNVGRNGAWLNTGVPGTGLYERTRLDAASRRSRSGGGSGSGGRNAERPHTPLHDLTGDQLVDALSLTFSVQPDGAVGTFLPDGEPLDDARLLRKVRRSPSFRAAAAQVRSDHLADLEADRAAILACAAAAPPPADRAELEELLASLSPRVESARSYTIPAPDRATVEGELAATARREVPFWPPWRRAQRRAAWVAQRIDREYAAQVAHWEADRDAYDLDERGRVEGRNRSHTAEYEQRASWLRRIIDGDEELLLEELQTKLSAIAYPLPLDLAFDLARADTVSFDIDLPEIEDLPQERTRRLASGKLSVRPLSERDLRADYARAVAALALLSAAHGFAASPAVAHVHVRGYTQRINPATGHTEDVYVIDVTFDREHFASLNLAEGDPLAIVRAAAPSIDPEEFTPPRFAATRAGA